MKPTVPEARTLQELQQKVNRANAAGVRGSAAGTDAPPNWRDALLDRFPRDVIRMIAILFGPMLVGAIVIPLMMIIFSLLGYSY